MNHKFLECLLLLVLHTGHAKSTTPIILHQTFNSPTRFLIIGNLSFITAAVFSAAGLSDDSLFIPILIIVAGLDAKTASCYSAFMVTEDQ